MNINFFKSHLNTIFDLKKIIIINSILVCSLIIDDFLAYSTLAISVSTTGYSIIYITLSCLVIFNILTIYRYLGQIKTEIKYKRILSRIIESMPYLNFVFIGLIVVITTSIIFLSLYYTIVLTSGAILSYSLTCAILITMSITLLLWYRSSVKSFAVLLYGITASIMATRVGIMIFFYGSLLIAMPGFRNMESKVILTEVVPGTFTGILGDIYSVVSVVSFMMLWITNAVFLRYYYKKIGKLNYFLVVGILPVYSMSDFVITPAVSTHFHFDDFAYWIYTAFQGLAAGIILSIPFFDLTYKLQEKKISQYFAVSGFGFIIFGISGSIIIDPAPYPPFGFLFVNVMPLGATLLFFGIYFSNAAISVYISLKFSLKKKMK